MRCSLSLLVFMLPMSSIGQTIPSDLYVIATAGGAFPSGPASEVVSVQMDGDGSGTYAQFATGLGSETRSGAFSLTVAEVGQIWGAIESSDFFDLEGEYTDPSVRDGSRARVTVRADGTTHSVSARNLAVDALESILTIINDVTPAEAKLSYDVVEPLDVTPVPVCEQPGKVGRNSSIGASLIPDGKVSTDRVLGRAVTPSASEHFAHPGTVVAYRLPLADAVKQGIAEVSAKGETYGDAVKIEVDNSGSAKTEEIKVNLYLDLFGSSASIENASLIESSIEAAWSGTTSSGEEFTVDVITRVTMTTTAPGTPGYHQIQLVEDFGHHPYVAGELDDHVNQGTAVGIWPSTGSDLDLVYAHEAGHLLGIDDRYDWYDKMPSDNENHPQEYWNRRSDDAEFTDEELLNEIAPSYPDFTAQEISEWIQEPGLTEIAAPFAGFEDNVMSNTGGDVAQGDIDEIAAKAGLLVEVRPGDVLVHKSRLWQSMAISRNEDVFVPAGETKTLEGLYAACIDITSFTPRSGDVFDVAPPLSEWNGIEAAQHALTLLRYLSEEERFCPADGFAQAVLWRLTNNDGMGDDDVTAYLADAGIDVGFRDLDFPSLSNPNSHAPGSGIVVPEELFVPAIVSSSGDPLDVAESISLTADLNAPFSTEALQDIEPDYLWSLEAPESSGAVLSVIQGDVTDLTPDVRGNYEVTLIAQLPDSLTGASNAGTGTFSRRSTMRFVAADSLVETFESGELTEEGPFHWRTGGGLGEPWTITDEVAHTGTYSVRSGPIGDNASTTLRAQFDQVDEGQLSFTYKLGSHFSDSLFFMVDGVVHGWWSGADPWTMVTVDLPPGFHVVSWTYVKDESDAFGADRAWLDDVFFPTAAVFTSVEEEMEQADRRSVVTLEGNAPNPFSETTSISYELGHAQSAEMIVYDALGRQVAVLASGLHKAGKHRVQFDAGNHANGIYYYRLRTEESVRSGKMVLLR